jgi:hypothetical protein
MPSLVLVRDILRGIVISNEEHTDRSLDQIEGIHCKGACTIENVWWIKVCEDALSLKGDGNALVKGGGAQGADDKVIQHNGKGTVTIDGFTVMVSPPLACSLFSRARETDVGSLGLRQALPRVR